MFSFTNEKSYRGLKFWGWLDEEDFQMADFQGTASWCITTRVRIRHVMIWLVWPHGIPLYFLDLSKQFKQNTCNIQFIEPFYLKYGIYKPREVKNHIKKLMLAYSFLYQIFYLPRFINLIFYTEQLINSVYYLHRVQNEKYFLDL